jgi:hypothetical protein
MKKQTKGIVAVIGFGSLLLFWAAAASVAPSAPPDPILKLLLQEPQLIITLMLNDLNFVEQVVQNQIHSSRNIKFLLNVPNL